MTTIVAAARHGSVWMAADSLVSVCERPLPGAVRKILRLPVGEPGPGQGEALLGVAGDGALCGLFRQLVRFGEVGATGTPVGDAQSWADRDAWMLTGIAREHGVLDNDRMDGMLLLAHAGQLWTVVHSQALPHPDGLAAVGSGADAALGAVTAFLRTGTSPWRSVAEAVDIAIRFDINSAGPVQSEELPDISEAADAAVVEEEVAVGGVAAG